MLHLLVPEETAAGSLAPNLDWYGPRTAHGSSLSPAIHAGLLARAGNPNRALELFRLACRLAALRAGMGGVEMSTILAAIDTIAAASRCSIQRPATPASPW